VRCLMVEVLKAPWLQGWIWRGVPREALLLAHTGRWGCGGDQFRAAGFARAFELYTRLPRGCGRECLPVIFVHGYSRQKAFWHALPECTVGFTAGETFGAGPVF